jgi:polysaccharide export outer membrane protein
MIVLNAVATAGGYSERANERQVMITRRVNGVIEKIEAPHDYVVMPGDTIYVTERWF